MTDEEMGLLKAKYVKLLNMYSYCGLDDKEKKNLEISMANLFDIIHYEDIFRQTGMNKEQWKRHYKEESEGEEWKN